MLNIIFESILHRGAMTAEAFLIATLCSLISGIIIAGTYMIKRVYSQSFVLTLVMIFFHEQVYGLFTSDPEVIAVGVPYVAISVFIFYGSACRSHITAQSMRGPFFASTGQPCVHCSGEGPDHMMSCGNASVTQSLCQ